MNKAKIKEELLNLTKDLEININELENYFKSIYSENISLNKLQDMLITYAVSLTSFEESDWTYLAGRLLMKKTEQEVFKNRNFSYGNLYDTVKTMVDIGIYDERLLEYSKEEMVELQKIIDISRDMIYDYAGANMFVNRYLLKYQGKVFELPQEVFMCIAMLLAINEKDKLTVAKEFYNALSLKKISLATPILANLRIPKGNLSSCFITAMDDNIESIFYNIDTIAKISKNGGGAGLNISRIRAKNSMVNGYHNASGGVIPWIKIINDTAVAVNQQGRRAGAVTVALDSWHLDIESFLELQTENGDQRGKAYDIYPQVVVSDIFMERVEKNLDWTLLDPYEIRMKYGVELCELYGEEFKKLYLTIESDKDITLKKVVKARELFKEIMKTQIETGMPYIFFKDRANLANHNSHIGMIGNGNLCMESFSNFSPTKDFKEEVFENSGVRKVDLGEVHTCNLVSLNLAEIEREELEKNVSIAVRILDNTIDLTKTPIKESDKHNKNYRAIGVGTMGLADYLAREYMIYEESLLEIDELFEEIALYSLKSSSLLAKERGSYPLFRGSKWEKGIFFEKEESWYLENSKYSNKWKEVFQLVRENGLRNGELTAVAPNTSTSLLMGATASVNPTFSRFYIEKNQKGAVPRVVKYLKDRSWFYPEFKNIDPQIYVKIMSRIGKWTTQGVSMELIFDLNKNIRAKDIYNTLITAWKEGCKSVYYIRTIQKSTNIINEKEECESCSG
ncbi:MAG: ribonucleoside-diphosphate reductase subunit alpha [Fusobacterium sp.]|nr:ribonucleoside-diphosphate reductase subunit alpha [Fusobacterium sp.]